MADKSIILLSGGLDSTLAFLIARETSEPILALVFDYGQNAARQEKAAVRHLTQLHNIPMAIMKINFLNPLGTHPLIGQEEKLPQLSLNTLDDPTLTQKSAHVVWVANRNGVFINMAASLAEQRGAKRIYVGFNREEAATFPDNSAAYVEAVNRSLSYSTLSGVTVHAPTIDMNKKDIVASLLKRGFDFSLVWSCYRDGDKMCGLCESCLRLKRAFSANGCARDDLFSR